MPTGTPTYLTQNPDGTVSADFSGHVFAQGLDLVALNLPATGIENRIAWHKDTKTGAVVASVLAYVDTANGATGLVNAAASPATQANTAGMTYTADDTATQSSVRAVAGSASRLAVDGLGQSNYAQIGSGNANEKQSKVAPWAVTWLGVTNLSEATNINGLGLGFTCEGCILTVDQENTGPCTVFTLGMTSLGGAPTQIRVATTVTGTSTTSVTYAPPFGTQTRGWGFFWGE